VVYRVGWQGARDLLTIEWTEAEADFMAEMITRILDHEHALRVARDYRMLGGSE